MLKSPRHHTLHSMPIFIRDLGGADELDHAGTCESRPGGLSVVDPEVRGPEGGVSFCAFARSDESGQSAWGHTF